MYILFSFLYSKDGEAMSRVLEVSGMLAKFEERVKY